MPDDSLTTPPDGDDTNSDAARLPSWSLEQDEPPDAPAGGESSPPTLPATNGLAIAAMVLGIVAFVTFGITALVGAPLGHVALRQSRKINGKGRAQAITGIVCSYAAVALVVAFIGLGIVAALAERDAASKPTLSTALPAPSAGPEPDDATGTSGSEPQAIRGDGNGDGGPTEPAEATQQAAAPANPAFNDLDVDELIQQMIDAAEAAGMHDEIARLRDLLHEATTRRTSLVNRGLMTRRAAGAADDLGMHGHAGMLRALADDIFKASFLNEASAALRTLAQAISSADTPEVMADGSIEAASIADAAASSLHDGQLHAKAGEISAAAGALRSLAAHATDGGAAELAELRAGTDDAANTVLWLADMLHDLSAAIYPFAGSHADTVDAVLSPHGIMRIYQDPNALFQIQFPGHYVERPSANPSHLLVADDPKGIARVTIVQFSVAEAETYTLQDYATEILTALETRYEGAEEIISSEIAPLRSGTLAHILSFRIGDEDVTALAFRVKGNLLIRVAYIYFANQAENQAEQGYALTLPEFGELVSYLFSTLEVF